MLIWKKLDSGEDKTLDVKEIKKCKMISPVH
jgi:hypothetical protein